MSFAGQHYYRSTMTITPYEDGKVRGRSIKVVGLIPSLTPVEDTTKPEVRLELLELAIEGIKTLIENEQPKENA